MSVDGISSRPSPLCGDTPSLSPPLMMSPMPPTSPMARSTAAAAAAVAGGQLDAFERRLAELSLASTSSREEMGGIKAAVAAMVRRSVCDL